MSCRINIVCGGPADPDFVAAYLKKQPVDLLIAADRGLDTCLLAGVTPDIVLGDYDSTGMRSRLDEMKTMGVFVEVYPAEKDFTDTEAAIRCALDRGADDIALLGATGGRLDHFLANLDLMLLPLRRGVRCAIVDERNVIRLLDTGVRLSADEVSGKYISLRPFTQRVTGVTLTGMKYPLRGAVLTKGSTLGISNEMTGSVAEVAFDEGIMILVVSDDAG